MTVFQQITYYFIFVLFLSNKLFAFNKIETFEGRTLELTAGANYFDTTENFNSQGSKVHLLGSNQYTLTDAFIESRYVFQNTWSVSGRANLSNAESKNTDFNRVNSTLNALSLTTNVIAYRGILDLIPEFTFTYSFDPITNNQDTVFTNEGVLELIALIKAQNNYSWFNYYLGAGFNYRSERSGILPWYLGSGAKWRNSYFGFEVGGFQSIVDDPDRVTAESFRYALISRVNGGSYRFYSVNPSHIYAGLNIDIGFSRAVILKTTFSNSISGQNYSSGIYFGAAITLAFDAFNTHPSSQKEIRSIPKKVKEEEPSDGNDYKIQTDDGVDQKIFEKEPEIPQAPKRVIKKHISDEDIQSQLDDAEMTIKLKSNKKRRRSRR